MIEGVKQGRDGSKITRTKSYLKIPTIYWILCRLSDKQTEARVKYQLFSVTSEEEAHWQQKESQVTHQDTLDMLAIQYNQQEVYL
ncbi:hypothetical protein H5410_035376 [Solanum commersonii]|uniref:Uncharacterized protein n=1 Tax=Solanum commersonii TaxID=4109 RepID=A0A9J5Y3L8_SOLCO|nr:hypothetical protein H5410_035376 [Solanum commersonii]